MANDVPSFLKRQGDALLFNLEKPSELVFYIPEILFERGNAIITGEYVNLIGILDYAIFDKNGKHDGLRPFRFPTVFLSKPGLIEKIKNVKLKDTSEEQDYRLLKFRKDDIVVVSTKVPQSIVNVEEFYKIFLTANLPTTIRYDQMHEYFTESMELNGASYGISIQMFGLIVSELCRDKNDINKPFRLSGNTNMTDYKPISIKDAPKIVSPHSSLTSENWDEAVVNAIMNPNVQDSPMEKLLMD